MRQGFVEVQVVGRLSVLVVRRVAEASALSRCVCPLQLQLTEPAGVA